MKNSIIVIVGPTASGKTNTAIKLAKTINGEVISCDSMQIYKGMPILTQAPSKKDLKEVSHYLIATLPPEREYSAAQFRETATGLIKAIIKKGKTPIIVGGTGLYVKALIDGLFPSPQKDLDLRKKLEQKTEIYGSAALHKELSEKDPGAASRIHPNDTRRIIRALEIYELTGIPMSRHKKNTRGLSHEKDLYEVLFMGLAMSRKELYGKIDTRIDKMFKNSLVKEVKKLLKKKLSITAKSALGIKEIAGYISGDYKIEVAKELLKKNTKRYAKRQLTWFKADKRIRWFDNGEGVISYCRHFL